MPLRNIVLLLVSVLFVVAVQDNGRSFNLSCSDLNMQDELDNAASCVNCTECVEFGYCIKPLNETTAGEYCLCYSFVPTPCEVANDSTHSLTFWSSSLKDETLTAATAAEPNGSTIAVTIPSVWDTKRWKSFTIIGVMLILDYCGENGCSNYALPINKEKFKSQAVVVSVDRAKLPSDIKSVNISYNVSFDYMRQLVTREDKARIEENSSAVLYSEQLSYELKTEEHEILVEEETSGSVSMFTVLLIIVLIALAIFGVFQLKRRNFWPFNKESRFKNFGYHYSPANDVTRPVRHTVSSGEEFLDEASPEIQEYRELLSLCPMILPFKLDVKEAIGHGKFGTIHKGNLLFDNNKPAMVHSSQSPYRMTISEVRVFLKNLEMTSKAGQHENILSIMGCCDQDQRLLICMEYNLGPNLQTLLRESRTLDHFSDFASTHHTASLMSSNRLLNLMQGVAEGVTHLEKKQIVHPHLAAINVLIGEAGCPKIAGFGFSKVTDLYAREGEKRHSVARWLAPESITDEDGHLEWTVRSQVWSLAVILWEIASLGGTPYAQIDSTVELLLLVRTAATRLEKLPCMRMELYTLMGRCWNGEALNRPSAAEVLEEIKSMSQNSENHLNLNLTAENTFAYAPIKQSLEEITEFQRVSLGI